MPRSEERVLAAAPRPPAGPAGGGARCGRSWPPTWQPDERPGPMPRGEERFLAAARELGLEPEVRRFPEGTRTAEDAARAIGCDVAQIVKSLVFVAEDGPFLALTSGDVAP